MKRQTQSRLSIQVAVLTLSRLFVNTGLRMVYPFMPAIARGLGVTVVALAPLIALRGFAGLLSPIFGPLSERYGRRPVLILSMILFAAGCLVILIWPEFWALGVSLLVIATAKVVYDPAMQAYIGDVVDYDKRGRILSITELSWAGAFFLGIPAIGFVIDRQGWTAPFFWLAILAIAGAVMLWRVLPGPAADRRTSKATTLKLTFKVIKKEKVIWAASLYLLLVMAANELLLVIYGFWMEDNFALSLTTLGLATAVIGAAELSGELVTAASVDRIGKRRFILITGLATAVMYIAVPFASLSLAAALATLFVLFLFFEMTVVGGVPLLTELVPAARGIVMSVALAAGGVGRAMGALIGPRIWLQGGMEALGLTSAAMMIISMVILALWIREAADPKIDSGLQPGQDQRRK